MPTFTTQQICEHLGGVLVGPGDLPIVGVEQIDLAVCGQLTFIGDRQHAGAWARSEATAALVSRGLDVEPGAGRSLICVDDADLAMAEVLSLFAPALPRPQPNLAPDATVDASAQIGRDVAIGPGCFVGPRASVGDGSILQPNVIVFEDVSIGNQCVVWSGCVIRERCRIGDGGILHCNVTIGADGFGYRPDPESQGWIKIPQIGAVHIGRQVEIGAGTCIDRGKFSVTVIGDQTKIDNLCQIGHNCRIGRACIIAGQAGIAGSVTIGNGVVVGGKVAIKDHVTIGDGAKLAGCAAVMNDVPAGEVWAGYPAREASVVRREHAAMRRLPDLVKLLKRK